MRCDMFSTDLKQKYLNPDVQIALNRYCAYITYNRLFGRYAIYKKSFSFKKKVDFITWCKTKVFNNKQSILYNECSYTRNYSGFLNTLRFCCDSATTASATITLSDDDLEILREIDYLVYDSEIKKKIEQTENGIETSYKTVYHWLFENK